MGLPIRYGALIDPDLAWVVWVGIHNPADRSEVDTQLEPALTDARLVGHIH